MKRIVLSILVLFCCSVVYGQSLQYSFSGKVVDSDGNPMAGVRVNTSFLNSRWAGKLDVMSDVDGNFVVNVPRPDTYLLTFGKTDSGLFSTYYRFYYPSDDYRPTVIVNEKKTNSNPVILRFPPTPGMLNFDIRNIENGNKVRTAQVKLCRIKSPNYCYTANEGMVAMPAISDGFSVQINSEYYHDWFRVFPNGIGKGKAETVQVDMEPVSRRKTDRLRAPEPVLPKDGADLYDPLRITKIEWLPVEGAASYTVDVEGCEAVSNKELACPKSYPLQFPNWKPTSAITGTSYEFNFLGNQPGRWRVWAVDSEGRPGIRSRWMTFFYHQ